VAGITRLAHKLVIFVILDFMASCHDTIINLGKTQKTVESEKREILKKSLDEEQKERQGPCLLS